MALPATDNFNRANASTLGANWTIEGGNGAVLRVVNNEAGPDPTTAPFDHLVFWNADTFSNDQYSQVTLKVVNGSNQGGLIVRASGAWGIATATHYQLSVTDTAWTLAKVVNTAETSLATGSVAFAANDVLKLQAVGTTIKAYKNGVQLGSDVTDSAVTAGAAGMRMYSTDYAARLDDWEGGNVSSGVSLSPAQGAVALTGQGMVMGFAINMPDEL